MAVHNQGCVWDKIASQWAGEKECSNQTNMSEFGGEEGLSDFRTDVREGLGRTQNQDWRKYQTK